MTIDMRLKLLELTNSSPAVSLNELKSHPRIRLDQAIVELEGSGLVTLSGGVLTMNGRQRVKLAEQLIHKGTDAKKVARFLQWQEFEEFAEQILSENEFSTCKHFVFKSSAGRREIDILAWNDTLMLAVDCKHWLKGLSGRRMNDVAQAQVERVTALARRPELLHRLKVPRPDGRSIIPVILALGEPRELVDGVPIVPVSKLLSFIYGVSPVDSNLKRIRLLDSISQSRLT